MKTTTREDARWKTTVATESQPPTTETEQMFFTDLLSTRLNLARQVEHKLLH